MSAIFGIWDTRGRPLDPAWLAGMQSDLAHRGPDGGGVWTEGSVGLGAQVLKISRSDAFESLPLVSDDFVLVSSARLDDRQALMDRLGLSLEQRKEIPDSQLIALAWRKWGKECPAQLCGDFAFVIWDRMKRQLFGARDHLGIRPFLYYFQNGVFLFGSEMRSVVKALPVKPEINESHLLDWVIGLYDRPEETPWQQVSRILPGHVIALDESGLRTWKYWKVESSTTIRYKDPRDYAIGLREHMELAVRDRLETDLPVGIMLSGGLDSSSIAAIATPYLEEKRQEFYSVSSIKSGSKTYLEEDEESLINELLGKYPWIKANFIKSEFTNFGNRIMDNSNLQYSPLNYFYNLDDIIIKTIRSVGARTVMCGYLGDLTVSNSTFRPLGYYFSKLAMAKLVRLIPGYIRSYNWNLVDLLATEMIRPGISPRLMYYIDKLRHHPRLFNVDLWPLSLSKSAKYSLTERYRDWLFSSRSYHPKSVIEAVWPEVPDGGPLELDVLAAHSQIRFVYPFIDPRIVEYLAGLPPEALRPNGIKRGLIREAMKESLPDSVKYRVTKSPYMPDCQAHMLNYFRYVCSSDDLTNLISDAQISWLDISRVEKEFFNFATSGEVVTFAPGIWKLMLLHQVMVFVQFYRSQ